MYLFYICCLLVLNYNVFWLLTVVNYHVSHTMGGLRLWYNNCFDFMYNRCTEFKRMFSICLSTANMVAYAFVRHKIIWNTCYPSLPYFMFCTQHLPQYCASTCNICVHRTKRDNSLVHSFLRLPLHAKTIFVHLLCACFFTAHLGCHSTVSPWPIQPRWTA